MTRIWVFHGENSRFASGVFSSRELAEAWIQEKQVSGVLTGYPLDVGVYDWAVAHEFFKVKREDQKSPHFIARFTSASQPHVHFEDGKVQAD